MAEPLRHRQTKEAATDMFSLQPPRHISTLPMLSKSQNYGDRVLNRLVELSRFFQIKCTVTVTTGGDHTVLFKTTKQGRTMISVPTPDELRSIADDIKA